MRAAHRTFRAGLRQLLFCQAGNHHRQFMRRQAISVMQHGGDRQVFATHRAIDHHAQAAHGGEGIDCAPVAAGAIVVQY